MNNGSENIYEVGTVSYSENRGGEYCNFRAPDPSANTQSQKKRLVTWKTISAIVSLLLIVVLLVTVLIFVVQQQNQITPGTVESNSQVNVPSKTICQSYSKSCLDLKADGDRVSGTKIIKLDGETIPKEMYCDMETDGGGWSLVASIHESDILAKCFSDDRWSGLIRGDADSIGKTNWENEMVFGHVHQSLQDDYKTSAYFKQKASDVMVWHVPRGANFDNARSSAKLRYRTTNGFLQKYGGNLKNLFSQHFPLTSTPDDTLDLLVESFTGVTDLVSDWNNYVINTGYNYITDRTLYSNYGSQVHVYGDRWGGTYVNYGTEYKRYYSELTSSTTAPLTVLMSVVNEDQAASYYTMQVRTYSRTSEDNVTDFEGNVAREDYRLYYLAREFYNIAEEYATECRFHFYISNAKAWKSIPPSRFYLTYQYVSSNYYRHGDYRIEGKPSRVLYGYMLLSKKPGNKFTAANLTDVAQLILKKVAKTPILEFQSAKSTLVVPVTFDQGSTDIIEKMTPPKMRSYVQAGNIQFRAFNHTGYPNAICPGISVNSTYPEHVCVGGISDDIFLYGTCGDFAGWNGQFGDTVSAVNAVGYAHSFEDILSTLMIFYR